MTQPTRNQPSSLQRTREQERASHAWEVVVEVRDRDYAREFKALVRGFPALILTNGLGHALAFLLAKDKNHHKALYQALNGWVEVRQRENKHLMEWLMDSSSDRYRRATAESLAYLVWLKRFAEANISGEGEP